MRMALAGAPHHGSGPTTKKVVERREEQEEVEHATHIAIQGPNTPHPGTRPGLLAEPTPQVRLETVARASGVDGLPTIALPALAGSAGEALLSSSWCRGSLRRS